MNHYPSLLLEKGTSDISTIMKYQQDQMILRAHAPKCQTHKVCLTILGHYVATLCIKGLKIRK